MLRFEENLKYCQVAQQLVRANYNLIVSVIINKLRWTVIRSTTTKNTIISFQISGTMILEYGMLLRFHYEL